MVESLYDASPEYRAGQLVVLADINALSNLNELLGLLTAREDLVRGVAISGYGSILTVTPKTVIETRKQLIMEVDGHVIPSDIWNDDPVTHSDDYDYLVQCGMKGVWFTAISARVTTGGVLRPGDRLFFTSPGVKTREEMGGPGPTPMNPSLRQDEVVVGQYTSGSTGEVWRSDRQIHKVF